MQKIHSPFVFLVPIRCKKQDLYGGALKADARSRGGGVKNGHRLCPRCPRYRCKACRRAWMLEAILYKTINTRQDSMHGPSFPKEEINKREAREER